MKELRISAQDRERFTRMNEIEERYHAEGYTRIAGVDEAGRGPLAGPVCAAACILDPEKPIYGLNDSKKIGAERRKLIATEIKEKALAWKVSFVSANEIDRVNILQATKIAMEAAIRLLQPQADLLLLDAVRLDRLDIAQRSIIKGDAEVNAIAAASILAKTERDRYMELLSEEYPGYAFERHKGYGTKAHYEALSAHGPCPEHRLSFLGKLRLGKSKVSDLEVGHNAEAGVASHLEAQGFKILERNFALAGFGEIDLIASRDNYLYFVEVKARSASKMGEEMERAMEAIDSPKIRRMQVLGHYYADSRGYREAKCILLAAACSLNQKKEVSAIRFAEIDP